VHPSKTHIPQQTPLHHQKNGCVTSIVFIHSVLSFLIFEDEDEHDDEGERDLITANRNRKMNLPAASGRGLLKIMIKELLSKRLEK
jgi:hypothetical protein